MSRARQTTQEQHAVRVRYMSGEIGLAEAVDLICATGADTEWAVALLEGHDLTRSSGPAVVVIDTDTLATVSTAVPDTYNLRRHPALLIARSDQVREGMTQEELAQVSGGVVLAFTSPTALLKLIASLGQFGTMIGDRPLLSSIPLTNQPGAPDV